MSLNKHYQILDQLNNSLKLVKADLYDYDHDDTRFLTYEITITDLDAEDIKLIDRVLNAGPEYRKVLKALLLEE